MQRYFANVINGEIFLTKEDNFHLLKVMRCKVGDELIAIDNRLAYLGEIVSTSPLKISVKKVLDEENNELPCKTTLFFTLAKGDKIDFVIQKAVELGASKLVLVKSCRCVVKMDDEDFKRKETRYKLIIKEASEQCHRNLLMDIVGVVDINRIPSNLLSETNLLAYEKEAGPISDLSFIKNSKSISIFIGPEGGLSKEEVDALNKNGFINISLGKRILRTETAAVNALSMINYIIER